jgi:uncharacterized coiled-coil protein SlyX
MLIYMSSNGNFMSSAAERLKEYENKQKRIRELSKQFAEQSKHINKLLKPIVIANQSSGSGIRISGRISSIQSRKVSQNTKQNQKYIQELTEKLERTQKYMQELIKKLERTQKYSQE